MLEVSFYILQTRSISERNLLACKLIEKAYRLEQYCYVYTDSYQQSQQLDNQLWTFRVGSFIPHQIYEDKKPDFEKTILIGDQSAPEKWQKLIINLSTKYPDDLTHTDRVLEVLDNNETIKQAGRHRFRQYSQAGYKTTTHKI